MNRFREVDRGISIEKSQAVARESVERAPVIPKPVTSTYEGLAQPEMVDADYDRAVTGFRRNVDSYFGSRFAAGETMRQAVDAIVGREPTTIPTSEKIEIRDALDKTPARTAMRQFSNEIWQQIGMQNQNLFLGIALQQAEQFGDVSVTQYQNKVASDAGRAEIFANLLDFVITTPDSASPYLIEFYESLGVVSKREVTEQSPAPSFTPKYSKIPVFGKHIDKVLETINAGIPVVTFDLAVAGLLDREEMSTSQIVRERTLMLFSVKDAINQSIRGLETDAEKIEAFKGQYVHIDGRYTTTENPVIQTMQTEEITTLRGLTPELSKMPIDTFLAALTVPANSIERQRRSDMSIQERYRYGLLTEAERTWFDLGITEATMKVLSEYLVISPKNQTLDRIKYAGEVKQQQIDEARIREYLFSTAEGREAPGVGEGNWTTVLPKGMITSNISPEFLYEMGFSEEAIKDMVGEGFKVPVIGGLMNFAGDLFSGFGLLDAWHDHDAESFLNDPTKPVRLTTVWDSVLSLDNNEEHLDVNGQLAAIQKTFNEKTNPDFLPGGKYRTRLTEIYQSPYTSPEQRNLIEDIAADFENVELNQWTNQYENPGIKMFVDLIDAGKSVEEAIEEVSSWRSLVTRTALGLDMQLMPLGGLVRKGGNAAFRAIRGIPQFEVEGRGIIEGLRAGQVLTRADDDFAEVLGELSVRRMQVESMLGNEYEIAEVITTGSTRGLGVQRVAGLAEDTVIPLNRTKIRMLEDELAEIDRILDSTEDTIRVQKDIFNPRTTPRAIYTGDSISDVFQIYAPIRRVIKQRTSASLPIGRAAMSQVDEGATLTERILSGTALRNKEFSQRASVVSYAFSVTDEFSQMLRKIPLSRYNIETGGKDLILDLKQFITDLATVGKTDNARPFLAKYNTHKYETERFFQTAELVGNEVATGAFKTLRDDVVIITDPEQFKKATDKIRLEATRLATKNGRVDYKKAQEIFKERMSLLYRSEDEFFAHFITEFNSYVTEAVSQRILGKSWNKLDETGKATQNIGVAMQVQNKLAGALSLMMLESPGFVIRNVINNFTVSTLDGIMPWQLFSPFGHPKYFDKYDELFGSINPLTYGFSPKGLGQAEINELRETLASSLFTKNPMGGGIPFVGGLPYMTFRKASAHFEAVTRMRITQKEAVRVMEQLWTPENMVTALNKLDPQAAALFNKLAASGPDTAAFRENLFRALTDHTHSSTASLFYYIDQLEDGTAIFVASKHPARIAEELGFHVPHLNKDALGEFQDVLDSFDPNLLGKGIANSIENSYLNSVKVLGEAGRQFGIPKEAVSDILEVHSTLYAAALGSGLPPKEASDLALSIAANSTMRIRGLYERNEVLLKYIDNPELYRDAYFPYVKGLGMTNRQLEEMVTIPSTPQINRKEILDMLTEEDEALGWKAANEIIDEARKLPSFGGQDSGIIIRRTVDNLSTLRRAATQSQRKTLRADIDKAKDAFIAKHQAEFVNHNRWTPAQVDAYLDDKILAFAEIGDTSIALTGNPNSVFMKVYLKGARPADVRRAIDRAIDNGTLQNKVFRTNTGKRNTRTVVVRRHSGFGDRMEDAKSIKVTDDKLRQAVSADKDIFPSTPRNALGEGLGTPALRATFEEFVKDITELANRVSQQKVAGAAGDIRKLHQTLNLSRQQTMAELRRAIVRETEEGNLDVGRLIEIANERLNRFARTSKERMNVVTDSLGLQAAPLDGDREAKMLARTIGENTTDSFTQLVSEQAPTVAFFKKMYERASSREGSQSLSEAGQEAYDAIRNAVFEWNAEGARVLGHPFVRSISREVDLDELADMTKVPPAIVRRWKSQLDSSNEAAIEWAKSVQPYPTFRPKGWNKSVEVVSHFNENAVVANIPEGVNVAPANIGMAPEPSLTGNLPASGVMGHVFYQRPPEGFFAVITEGDEWASIVPSVKKQSRYGTHFAIFIRKGTPEKEVEEAVRALAKEHYDALLDPKQTATAKATGRMALEKNPRGFYASYQIESPVEATRKLAPFVAKAEQGDMVAKALVQNARYQWLRGWPISGDQRRSLDDAYNTFKRSFSEAAPVGPYLTKLTPQEAGTLRRGVETLIREKNQVMDFGMALGQARADFILHNYNNVNDIDFILRWLGPWHIWPTRTMGKLFTRVVDNPHWYVGYKAFETALELLNEELPDYMKNTLPIDFLLGALALPLKAAGIDTSGFSGGSLNVGSVLFYNDLIGQYQSAGEGATGLGEGYDAIDDFIPMNPMFGWGLNLTGQMGQKDLSLIPDQLIRPAEMITQLGAELTAWTGSGLTSQIIMSDRDIRDVNNEFAASIMAAGEKGGTDPKQNPELAALIEAFDEWGRMSKDGIYMPLLQQLGAQLGIDQAMNPILVSTMVRASRNRTVANATSYLGGHRLTLRDGDQQAVFAAMEDMRDVLGANYETDVERSKAISNWFKDNPAVSVYLRNGKETNDLNALAQTEALFFGGLAEVSAWFDEEYAKLPAVGSNISEEDTATAYTRLQLERDARIAALGAGVYAYTGIDPRSDRNFDIQYRISQPEMVDLLERYNMEEVVPMVYAFGSYRGEETPILPNIDLIAAGSAKDALIAEVEKFAKETGVGAEFVTVGQINRGRVMSQVTSIILDTQAAINMPQFYKKKDGAFTNAVDVDTFFDNQEKVLAELPKTYRDLYNEFMARSLSPEQAIDKAINEWAARTVREHGNATNAWSQSDRSTDLAATLARIEKAYKPPTPKDIATLLDEMTGGLWRNNTDITQSELDELIQVRLDNAARIGDLNTILTAKYEDNIGALSAGLGRLESLRSEPDSPEVRAQIRDLTGYEDENGVWVPGELRHFTTPSGVVITTAEELSEFREAYEFNQELQKLHDADIHIRLDSEQFETWSKYFNKEHSYDSSVSKFLNYLKETKQWQLFDAAVNHFYPDKEAGAFDENVYNADGTIKPPVRGVPSHGMATNRINSNYRLPDLGSGVALSRTGQLTKAYLEKHFSGANSKNMPPDYLFELLAINGITEEEEILDFFWSVYEINAPVFAEQFDKNSDVAFTLFSYTDGDKDSDGRPKVSSYQYLIGLRGMYDTIYGYQTQQVFNTSGKGSGGGGGTVKRDTGTKSRVPKLPSGWKPKNVPTPTNTGAGGLPQWSEAMSYFNSVFSDPTLVEDVITYFQKSNHRMTNNHMRMLRAMHKTFPIASANTFEEWLSGLKLMFKTADLVTARTKTLTNPASGGYDSPPRFAKFR